MLKLFSVKRRGHHVRIATGADVGEIPNAKLLWLRTKLQTVLCRYPDVFKHARHELSELSEPKIPSPSEVVRLSDTPMMYSPDDMQLFHHYLMAAYPCVPQDRDEVWVRDIPLKSHQASRLVYATATQRL